MRLTRLSLLLLLPAAMAACGARSPLFEDEATPTAVGGAPAMCTAWQLVPPVVPLPAAAAAARAAEVSLADDDEDLDITVIEAPPDAAGVLRYGRLRAVSEWPPDFSPVSAAASGVTEYVAGEGAKGPVALLATSAGLELATTLLPSAVTVPQPLPGGTPVLVAGLPDRWIFAAARQAPGVTFLDVGSYQQGWPAQSEVPDACISSKALGAAVPAGQGFIAALGLVPPAWPMCEPDAPRPAMEATVYRYDVPAESGTSLLATQNSGSILFDPLAHLALARTPSGAWMVIQGDGSMSGQLPPVLGMRVTQQGMVTSPIYGQNAVEVVPHGTTRGPIAVAPLGEALVVAWVGMDAEASSIFLRTVAPDGSLGPIAAFDTGAVPLRGRLRVIAARSLQTIVLTWDRDPVGVGVARLDCAPR